MLRRPARSKAADSSPLNGSGEYQSAFDLCFVEAKWLFFTAVWEKKRVQVTSSSHRGEAGERVVFEDAKLLYVKTNSETSKFGSKYKSADRCIELTPAGIERIATVYRQRLRVTRRFHTENYAFIVDDKDVVMWRTNDKNKEATLLAPGFIVDFVGTVSDQSTDGGVNVTTVTRLKVLIVDGARVAPTPKPKKRKKGAEDGDDDDDDEPAAAAKKARVAEGDETDDG